MSTKKKAFQFTWSSQEFNLKDFVKQYKARLPMIVMVTEGYCGYDESQYTYGAGEIFLITDVKSQHRIIARDVSQKLLSIPEEYPVKFHIIQKRKQLPATSLEFLCKLNQFQPGIQVIPENGAHLTYWIGADKTMETDIGTLELVDTYEDLYLVGNSITPWPSEIMLFDECLKEMLTCSSDYNYIEPKAYISCAEVAALRNSPKKSTSTILITMKPDTTPTPVVPPRPSKQSERRNTPLPQLPDETKSSKWSNNTSLSRNSTKSVKQKWLQMKITPPNHISQGAEYLEMNRGLNLIKAKNPDDTSSSPFDTEWGNDDDIQPYVTTFCKFTLEGPNTQTQKSSKTKYFSNINEVPLSLNGISVNGNPDVTSSSQFDPEWGNDDDIQPYVTTYRKFSLEGPNTQTRKSSKTKYFSKINEVPLSLNGISVNGISNCLKLLHLDNYVQVFNDNDIDGTLLTSLDKDSLMDLGLSRFEAYKLYRFTNGWRPKDTTL